jgi:hypothetical protein
MNGLSKFLAEFFQLVRRDAMDSARQGCHPEHFSNVLMRSRRIKASSKSYQRLNFQAGKAGWHHARESMGGGDWLEISNLDLYQKP